MDKEQLARVWARVNGESCPLWNGGPDILTEQLQLCSALTELYALLRYPRFRAEKQKELKLLQTDYFLLTAEQLPLLPQYGGAGDKRYLLRECINLEERSAALYLNGEKRESCLKRSALLREELGKML